MAGIWLSTMRTGFRTKGNGVATHMARYGVERKLHTSTITNIRHVGEHFVVKPGPVRQPVVRGRLRGLQLPDATAVRGA